MNLAAVEGAVEAFETHGRDSADLGDWGWLHTLDAADLREFVDEIRAAIIVGAREGSSDLLDEQLAAWKVTAAQADDPIFRSILRAGAEEEDFVEVGRPGSVPPSQRDRDVPVDLDGGE